MNKFVSDAVISVEVALGPVVVFNSTTELEYPSVTGDETLFIESEFGAEIVVELELYSVVIFDSTVELEYQAVCRGETALAKFVFLEALFVELNRLVTVVSTEELLEI